MLRMWAMLTTIATITTISTIRTTVTTLTTLRALTTLTACGTLYIVGRLLNQNTMRQLVLACLRINFQQLHLNLVTFLDTSILNGLKTLPVDF